MDYTNQQTLLIRHNFSGPLSVSDNGLPLSVCLSVCLSLSLSLFYGGGGGGAIYDRRSFKTDHNVNSCDSLTNLFAEEINLLCDE